MAGINWNDWLNREQITIDDALWLSMPIPIKPPGTAFPETSLFDDEYKERREIAESWRESGQLQSHIKPEEKDRDYYIKPFDVFRLARDIGWLNLLNPEHDAIYGFLEREEKSRLIAQSSFSTVLEKWVNKGLDKHLTHFEIVELWATPERLQGDVNRYEGLISQAVEDGDLLAEVSMRNPKALGGFEVIPYSPTTLRQANNGVLNGGFLQFTIHRDKFREWLIKSNQWPLADGCLLARWWPQTEQQAEAVEDGGAVDSLIPAQNDLQKRTKVLQDWLVTQKEYNPGQVFVLPKGINHKNIQITLNNESTDKMLFDLTLDSFKRHFWQKQKIAALKRGR